MNNRIPTPSSHIPSTQSSVPQIRSRITVVCAECKRLKLKCDRRNPCGSCTKRDTVSRCVYSPAAAEKVDLHSLNNRLIQVEATLSLLTSGQTPPVFQSSYPYSQVQSNGASNVTVSHSLDGRPSAQLPTGPQHHHRHHHHNSAPPCSSDPLISLSPRDLSSIWLDELDRTESPPLHVKLPYNLTKDSDSIKLETSIGEFSYGETSRRSSPPLQSMHFSLPPLSFYYASGSSVRFPDVQPVSQTGASTSYIAPQPHGLDSATSRPTVTPSLVALLPSLARAKQLLGFAADILRQRPVPLPACLLSSLPDGGGGSSDVKPSRKGKAKACLPFLATHWDALEFRALCLIGSRGMGYGTAAKTADRKEREKVNVRAREIFFGSGASSNTPTVESLPSQRPGSQTPKRNTGAENGTSERATGERGESLPFFAIVCFLLALGAVGSKAGDMEPQMMMSNQTPVLDEKESPEFLYALGQQSLGVWENSSMAVFALNADDKEASKADEDEKLDYLVASLLGVGYQLFESHANSRGKDSGTRRISILNKMFTSVGKMVNTARSMGLGRDRKSPVRCKNEGLSASGKDGRKRIKTGEKRRRKDELRRLIWWDIVFYELFISDTLGHSSLLSNSLCAVKLPCCTGPHLSADELESDLEDDQQDFTSDREEQYRFHEMLERYHAARCRLANIAQLIKRKLVHPDCCCGYTLDQAGALEREVSCFLEDLPPPLRFALMEETEGDSMAHYQVHDLCRNEAQRSTLRWQGCELAIMAQRLIIMIYLPFLRASASASANLTPNVAALSHDSDSAAQNSGDATWNPALQPILNAAQCIIQASKAVLQASTFAWSSDQRVAPLFDLYPVEKALLDATIICAHAGTFHGTLFGCRQAADNASLGMGLLLDLDLDLEFQVLLDRVKKRFYVSVHPPESFSIHGTKRKHGLIGAESGGRDLEALRHPSHRNAAARPMTIQPPPPQQGMQNNMSSDLVGGRASSVESACSGRDPETGQKGKKHAKKNHPHPPVGIRVRQKEALPPFLRHRIGSPSISIPSPGRESGMQTPQQENDMQSSLVASPAGEGPQQQLTPLSDFGPPLQPQMGPSPPVMASLLDESSYRPSSCSLNQDPHLHSQSQHEPRQSYPTPYGSAYEQGSRLASQEPQVNASRVDHFEGSGDSDTQNMFNSIPHGSGAIESGPYGTSGHVSSDTSPYIPNGSVNPSITPFGQATRSLVSHRSTPAYAQEMATNTNGHPYYHISPDPSFSTIYDRSEDASSYADIGLNTTNGAPATIIHGTRNGSTVDVRGLTGAVSNPPAYDVKLERLVQPPMHNHPLHHQPYSVGQRHVHSQNQHPMSMEQQSPAWASQQAIAADCSQRFWAPSVEFKYGH